MKQPLFLSLTLIASLLLNFTARAQVRDFTKPKVLVVVAHPDDEYFFAATTYRITHDLGGTVDQVVLTDGRGGFRYSLLSQPLYGKTLTDAAVAAKKLPRIRRGELAQSGKILGIGKHIYLDHLDQKTLDLNETYQLWGGKDQVKQEVKDIIVQGKYDFIFIQLPTETNHGHHKAAAILSLEVVNEMAASERPVILGSSARTDGDSAEAIKQDDPEDSRAYTSYRGNEVTRVLEQPVLSFDRNQKFGFNNNLSYQIVVNWMIAAHKSQGAFQNYYNKHRYEDFRVYSLNSVEGIEKAKSLFKRLSEPTDNSTFNPVKSSR